MTSGPASVNRQFQPVRAPTRHPYESIEKAIADSIIGLAKVAISQSFQPAASKPGRHQQTSEPITALAASRLEKTITAVPSRKAPATAPVSNAPMTWP